MVIRKKARTVCLEVKKPPNWGRAIKVYKELKKKDHQANQMSWLMINKTPEILQRQLMQHH